MTREDRGIFMKKANLEIREAAKSAGVRLWQIADVLKMHESAFSVKLRKELPTQERDEILQIIAELAVEA